MKTWLRLLLFSALLVSSAKAQSAFEDTQEGVSRSPLAIYGGQIDSMALAPNGNLYVGLNSPNGIFCSTDGAATWQGPSQGSDFGTIAALTVGETSDTIYMIGGIGFYKSINACATWTQLQSSSGVSDFGRDVVYGHGTLLASFRNGTVERSTNQGSSFTNVVVDVSATEVLALAVSPAANTFFAVVKVSNTGKLYKSTDAGVSWQDTGKSGDIRDVGVDPADADRVLLVGQNTVELSTNGGTLFTNVSPFGIGVPGISFVSVPGQADRIFVGSSWTTDGSAWVDINQTASSTQTELTQLIFQDPSNENKYYMASNRGIAVSTNTGDTWVDSVEGMLGVTVRDIAQSTDKSHIYLAGTGGMAKSSNYTDEEPSWTYPIDPSGQGNPLTAVYLPDSSNPDIVLAGGTSTVYKSINGGTSWTPINLFGLIANKLVVDFTETADGTIYAAYADMGQSGNGGVLKSTNDGDSWTDAGVPNAPVVNRLLAIGDVLYAAAGSENNTAVSSRGIYKLENSVWSQLSGEIEGEKINDLAYNGSYIFAAAGDVNRGGVFRSSDNGAAWEDLSSQFEEVRCMRSLAVDPEATDTVYVAYGCPSGTALIYQSTDAGSSWSVHYTALRDEVPSVMLVDDLLAGMNTGAYEFQSSLSSPVYALWNGFLSMNNVLELVNKGESDLQVTVTMYTISGAAASAQTVTVPAQGQYDVLVNLLPGFSADSYGIVRLDYSGSSLDGRLSYYRSVDGYLSYEFAFGIPYNSPLTGNSYVAYNTFQPSTNPADAANVVYNWLSIVNLEESTKTFTVNRYALDGTLQRTDAVTVPALGRMDIDGGHGQGANQVGYNAIAPGDASARYIAQLVRYGDNRRGGYDFAFPLIAKPGAAARVWAPISSGAGAQNWLEVQNITAGPVDVVLTFYDNLGTAGGTESFTLAAHSGRHVEASARLSAGASGAVSIATSTGSAVIAQSMFYFRDVQGNIKAMYGSQSDATASGTSWGSWNLFLDAYNWLRIFNTQNTSQNVIVTAYSGRSRVSQRTISLGAGAGVDLGLHDTGTYGTAVNSYGLVSVEGTGLITDLLRIRPDSSGGIDFVAVTAVRP